MLSVCNDKPLIRNMINTAPYFTVKSVRSGPSFEPNFGYKPATNIQNKIPTRSQFFLK